MKNCLICGKKNKLPIHKFCSRACFFIHNDKRIERICKQCSKSFKCSASRLNLPYKGGSFCSKRCMGIAHSAGKAWAWKGGRHYMRGYVMVHAKTHPYTTKRGYVYEHRLVMEKMIGRYLLPHETVHHKNGVKDDNEPKNLELVTKPGPHVGQLTCPSCNHVFSIR